MKLTAKSTSFQQIDQFKQSVLENSAHSNVARLEFANMQNEFLKDVVSDLLNTMKAQSEQFQTLLADVKKSGETCAANQTCVLSKSKFTDQVG